MNNIQVFGRETWNEITFHRVLYSARMSRSPSSTAAMYLSEIEPTRSRRNILSIAKSCETFTTESLGRHDAEAGSRTLPGASASLKFVVIPAMIKVRSLL